MERLVASADVQPSTRLTLSGISVHENANANDHRPHGSVRGNESGNDYERPMHEDVP